MSLSKRKIALLREFVEFKCESCHKHEKEVGTLEPHRIQQGGDYKLNNIQMLCSDCHEIRSSAQRISNGIQGRWKH